MRLNSLLFVAVLFATSSTRSMSASVGRLRSNKENARADSIEDETITEERIVYFPPPAESIERMSSMASRIEKKMLKIFVPYKLINVLKAYKLLRINRRLEEWVLYLQRFPKMTVKAIPKIMTRLGDASVVQMIEALKVANVDDKILGNFKDALIKYWKDQEKSSLDVLKLLKLDHKGSLYTPTELELFEMWIKFSTEKSDRSIVEVCESFDVDVRVRVLDGLRQIDDTPNVNSMENALVQSLSHRNGDTYDYSNAFKDLKLDENLEKLLDHRNLAIFYGYAVEAFPGSSKATTLIIPSRKYYGDKPLGEMLDAAMKKDVPDAEPLLKELFRQWSDDVPKIEINQVAEGEVKVAYDAYVKEMNKDKDA